MTKARSPTKEKAWGFDKKEKNKKIYQRRDITKVVSKTSEGDSKKNDQTNIFPLQSFSKVPTASMSNIV